MGPMKTLLMGLLASLLMAVVGFAAINYSDREKPQPTESAILVVEKFYELISEAKIRGGTMLISEAYKLTDGAQTQTAHALFLEVVNRYPSGFKVEVVDSVVQERHAVVTIEYRLPTSFGDVITIRTPVHLNVDEQSNIWKVDFRGDTDDQSRENIAQNMQTESGDPGLNVEVLEGDSQ